VLTQPPTLEGRDNGQSVGATGDRTAAARGLGLGLGLGHQVVRRIAAVHDGRFEVLDHAEDGYQAYRVVLDPAGSAATETPPGSSTVAA
jgi:two-component system sensor histidine kinase QseC